MLQSNSYILSHRGHSLTRLTKFWLFLNTYLPTLVHICEGFLLLLYWKICIPLTFQVHTTYLSRLVNVVCKLPPKSNFLKFESYFCKSCWIGSIRKWFSEFVLRFDFLNIRILKVLQTNQIIQINLTEIVKWKVVQNNLEFIHRYTVRAPL